MKYNELKPNALYEMLNAKYNEENWESFPLADKCRKQKSPMAGLSR